eukprot:scaffold107363_cov24-Tisochrysis_lutea.AAC.1
MDVNGIGDARPQYCMFHAAEESSTGERDECVDECVDRNRASVWCMQVDREKTCPLLLRVYTKHGSHHKLEEFAVGLVLRDLSRNLGISTVQPFMWGLAEGPIAFQNWLMEALPSRLPAAIIRCYSRTDWDVAGRQLFAALLARAACFLMGGYR